MKLKKSIIKIACGITIIIFHMMDHIFYQGGNRMGGFMLYNGKGGIADMNLYFVSILLANEYGALYPSTNNLCESIRECRFPPQTDKSMMAGTAYHRCHPRWRRQRGPESFPDQPGSRPEYRCGDYRRRSPSALNVPAFC